MSEIHSTQPITRRELADAIDGYDDQIAALQNAKSEEFKAYRAELLKAGYEQADARLEIEACKAAIKRRRAAAKNKQAVEERDALVAEIYDEISLPRAHAREDEVPEAGPSPPMLVRARSRRALLLRTRSRRGACPDLRPPENIRRRQHRISAPHSNQRQELPP